MAARECLTASRIAKMFTETIDFHSTDVTEALTEYFGDSGVHDDCDDWANDEPDMEDIFTEASDDADGYASDVDNFSLIQPVTVLKPEECGFCDNEMECFSVNAGKPDSKLSAFFTCSCTQDSGSPCYEQFKPQELLDLRMQHITLERETVDFIILSQLRSSLRCGDITENSKRRVNVERKKVRSQYTHQGKNICRELFKFIHGVEKDRLGNLIKHFRLHGVISRQHGNKNRMPKHSLSFEEIEKVVFFITNYAEEHGILLPGRIPGYKRDNLKLLPSSCTKTSVYTCYATVCAADASRCVAKRTFLNLWQIYKPEVLPMRPMTDLCWQCQKNTAFIQRAANLTDVEKIEVASTALKHLNAAAMERKEYRRVVEKAKEEVQAKELTRLEHPGNNVPDCSRDMMAHYSFDFAQQIHYPSNPLQPGPIYFKTPRKCGVFGIMTEALPQMVLFLLDEAVETGKGANTVISLLDFFFENYGLKEVTCHLHADNCSGQNKNNAMLQYLMWRVMTGRHNDITLSFLLAGHTKFGPDWCFGLFKRTFRRTKVDCLADITQITTAASSSGFLIPQLCGDEAGHVLVPTRDWTGFLSEWFQKLIGLKKFHHFQFKPSGEVLCQESVEGEITIFSLLKGSTAPSNTLPKIIEPSGLTQQRKQYLYDEIRQFVDVSHQDLVCPDPAGSVPSAQEAVQPSTSTTRTAGRPRKKSKGMAAKKI